MTKDGRKKSHKTAIFAVLGVIFILLLASLTAFYTIWKSFYGRSNRVEDEDFPVYYSLPEEAMEELDPEDESEEETENESLVAAVKAQIESAAAEHEMKDESYVYNILLVGSDRRDASWYGNSDTMILVSVNTHAKKIFLTSFMRDLYANIPGIGVRKLNAAYAHGAAPLLVQTIEDNFRIDIDNWASVDFNSMQAIVDIFGGVDLELNQAEADLLNSGTPGGAGLSAGVMHLNGAQAVSFARIRSIGMYDYERTSRQRRVLEQLALKLRGVGLSNIEQVASAILPLITHNISEGDLLQKILSLPEWLSYELVQDRIPYDGLYGHQGEMLVPDYAATIPRLRQTIYGE